MAEEYLLGAGMSPAIPRGGPAWRATSALESAAADIAI
jgi:hypothetical protein